MLLPACRMNIFKIPTLWAWFAIIHSTAAVSVNRVSIAGVCDARHFLGASIFVIRPTLVSPAYRLPCESIAM